MALEARSRDLGHRRDCAAADTLPPESTLLRANPPKGGDAEPRGYRGRRSATLAGPPATDTGRRWRLGVRWDPRRVAMPFAYKLAYRLARLKHRTLAGAAAAVAAAALLSCELPKQVAAPSAPVSQLIIIPHTVTLQLNQDQDFVAVGLSAAGDTTPSTVSWDVTGGTITDMGASGGRHYGQYHGGTCGSFKVAATSHPDRTTDTATVTVAGCVAPVAAVTVRPASAGVQQGATVQLTATPRDANGTALSGRVVTWGSNNTAVATVSGSGLVSGAGAGSATITATSEGQSGTAAITVTAPTGQLAIGDSVQAAVRTCVRNVAQPPAAPATGP